MRDPFEGADRGVLEILGLKPSEVTAVTSRGVLPPVGRTLPPLVADWPELWRAEFAEHAAIMEFEGLLTRAEAERLTEAAVRRMAGGR